MKCALSYTIRSIALLAIVLASDLAYAQRGGMGPGMPNPAMVPRWSNTAVPLQQEVITAQSPAAQAAEDHILAILKTPFTGNTHNTTLSAVLAGITQASGLPIHFDRKALEDASIGLDSDVNCELPPVNHRSALDMILKPLDLTWIISDECVLVTTPDKASNELITRVYPVLDLVAVHNPDNPGATNYQALLQLISDTVAPTTWDEVGGPGSVSQFHASGSIVASQTREVHEQVLELLIALRRARNAQVVGGNAAGVGQQPASRRLDRSESAETAEPARYVVTPSAAWARPLVHE